MRLASWGRLHGRGNKLSRYLIRWSRRISQQDRLVYKLTTSDDL